MNRLDIEPVLGDRARLWHRAEYGPGLGFTVDGRALNSFVAKAVERDFAALRDRWGIDLAEQVLSDWAQGGNGDFLDDGRYAIHRCDCTEPMCGALSARIVRVGDTVEWQELAYQDGSVDDFAPPDDAPTFVFAASDYDALLAQLRDRVRRSGTSVRLNSRWSRNPLFFEALKFAEETSFPAPPQLQAVWAALGARYTVTEPTDHPSGTAWFFECRDSLNDAAAIISAGDEDDVVVEYQGEFYRDWAVDEADLAALITRAVDRVDSLLGAR